MTAHLFDPNCSFCVQTCWNKNARDGISPSDNCTEIDSMTGSIINRKVMDIDYIKKRTKTTYKVKCVVLSLDG